MRTGDASVGDTRRLVPRRRLSGMSVRTSHRVSAGVAPLLAAGLLLSACGGDEGEAASRPTITLEAGETTYATLPPATTAPPVDETAEDAPSTGVPEYTVQAGDYGIKVAQQFGVSLDDLSNVNGWSDPSIEFPSPGTIIKIPEGATSQATDTGGGDDGVIAVTGGESEAVGGETGEAIPEVGDNCEAGSYVIEAGDTTRFAVANKFDVTVEAMDAANSGTNGYDAFYPGLSIVIPAKDDC